MTKVTRGLIVAAIVAGTVFAVDMLMMFLPVVSGLSNGAQTAIRIGLIAGVASITLAFVL